MKPLFYFILLLLLFSCTEKKAPGSHNPQSMEANKIVHDSSKTERPKWISFQPRFTYDSFPAHLYKGKLADPDFSTVRFGGEKAFQEYLLNKIGGKGINFAGQFTIVERSCGAMCEGIYIVDRRTGHIFTDFSVNNGGRWGYRYTPTSLLLIANAEMLNDSLTRYSATWGIKPELYVWNGKELESLQ